MIREVAPGDVRVETFGVRHLDELVEHVQVVLAVGVDGEHEVVGVQLAGTAVILAGVLLVTLTEPPLGGAPPAKRSG